jgi:hypothetical protein
MKYLQDLVVDPELMISPSIFLSVGPTLLDKWGWFERPPGQASSDCYNYLPGSWASPRFPAPQCLPASASARPGIGRGYHWQGIRPISTPCLGPENMPLLRSIRVHTCILLLVHSPPPSPSASRPPPLGRPGLGHLHNIPTTSWAGGRRNRALYLPPGAQRRREAP